MTEETLSLFDSFLVGLDRTLKQNRLKPLKNCEVHRDFLSLLLLDRLEQLLNLLEACEPNSWSEDILGEVRREIIYRHLMRVPRNFHDLYEFLNARYPDDPLTQALPKLIQEIAEAKDWKSEEAVYLGFLRRLKEQKSTFGPVIARCLGAMRADNVPIYLAFIRRPNSAISTLIDRYIPRTIVRRIITVGSTNDSKSIFADSGLKIRDDFSNTVRLVQTQALQFLQSRKVDEEARYVQYLFFDPLDHINSLQIEGRSAALAIAVSVFTFLSPTLTEYRDLAPYIAYFGAYTRNSFDEVDSLQEKVEAAREQGVRVIVIAESSKESLCHYDGCEPVDFPISSLKEVLRAVIEKVTPLAVDVSRQLRQADIEKTTFEILDHAEEPITWAHLQSVADKQIKEGISNVEGDIRSGSKYVQRLYVSRKEIESDSGLFYQFLLSDKPIFLVLGESGTGKSNLMCQLTKHGELEDDCAVFFYEARNISDFAMQFCYDLKIPNIDALIEQLNEGRLKGKKVVVFLDAINEHYKPFELMKEIMLLCSGQSGNPGFRIAVSCRTPFWKDIQPSLEEFSSLLYTTNDRGDKYPTLGKFRDEDEEDELALAFRKYKEAYYLKTDLGELSSESRSLIQDPFILKLVAKTYSEKDGIIPINLDIQNLFEAYESSRYPDHMKELYKPDKKYIDEILKWMWKNRSNRLEREVIDSNFELLKMVHMDDPTNERFSATTYVCKNCNLSLPKNLANHSECPRCHGRDLLSMRSDKRTAFDRLRDEGILKRDEDGAIRFTYDRHYEYRTAKWLLKQNGGELTVDKVRVLAMVDDLPIPTMPVEALKQAILLSPNVIELLVELAKTDEAVFHSIVEDCIVRASRRGKVDKDKATSVMSRLTNIGGQARLIAIRAACDVDAKLEPSEHPLLAPISSGDEGIALRQAVTQSLYGIWLRADGAERALALMEEMAKSVSPWKLIRGNTAPLMILLDVTLRTLGILHDDRDIVEAFGSFWKRLLTQNLYLGRREIHTRFISSMARSGLILVASGFVIKKLKNFGISIGKADQDFTKAERQAVLTLLEAFKGDDEAFGKVVDKLAEFGLESVNPEQRHRPSAIVVYLLSSSLLAVRARRNLASVVCICDELFERSRDFHNNGSGTRYLVYSQLNYAVQLYYDDLGPENLKPCLDAMLRYYNWTLEEDRESLIENPISEEFPGVTGAIFGLFFEVVTRMGGDLDRDIIEPMLAAAKEGCPNLIKAYLGDVSACCLDTFCRRYSAHSRFLQSLPRFADFKGIDAGLLMKWITEAYAVISVGYRSDVEGFFSEGPNRSILGDIRRARSQPSDILRATSEGDTLEQEMNSKLEVWSFSDGINSLIALRPEIQEQLAKYISDYFELKYNSLKDLIQHGLQDLLDYLMAS